jgi:hypothetical protein
MCNREPGGTVQQQFPHVALRRLEKYQLQFNFLLLFSSPSRMVLQGFESDKNIIVM